MRALCIVACALLGCTAEQSAPQNAGGGGEAAIDAATTTSGGMGGTGGISGAGGMGGATPMVDNDGDGIDDAEELAIAAEYFPFYAVHPDDACPLHGVLFRLFPHPVDATKLMIFYDVLFQNDCGLNGHVGDNEEFSVLVNPTLSSPDGILAVRAVSHEGTLCEQVTTCGKLPSCTPCADALPRVFASKDKHGGFVDEGKCDASFICDAGGCDAGTPSQPIFANAGEPGAPLTNDLTAAGLITSDNGWTEPAVMNYDPWGGAEFGTAGIVADDLVDMQFLIDPQGC